MYFISRPLLLRFFLGVRTCCFWIRMYNVDRWHQCCCQQISLSFNMFRLRNPITLYYAKSKFYSDLEKEGIGCVYICEIINGIIQGGTFNHCFRVCLLRQTNKLPTEPLLQCRESESIDAITTETFKAA